MTEDSALAPLTCQIRADVLGREIETIENPQNAGAVGAAAVAAVGLGIIDQIYDVENLIKVNNNYIPVMANKAVHDRNYQVFKSLYRANRQAFQTLNY